MLAFWAQPRLQLSVPLPATLSDNLKHSWFGRIEFHLGSLPYWRGWTVQSHLFHGVLWHRVPPNYTLARKYYVHNFFVFGTQIPNNLQFSQAKLFSGNHFPKLHYTHSLVIKRLTWKCFLGIQKSVIGIDVAIISGWRVQRWAHTLLFRSVLESCLIKG